MTIYHIRAKLTPKGGNQFYRDRSIRTAATLCGAPVTSNDVAFRDKAISYERQHSGEQFEPCGKCVETRKEIQPWQKASPRV